MTIGEKIQEVLKGIKVIENKEYNLMTISKEIWDSEYQNELFDENGYPNIKEYTEGQVRDAFNSGYTVGQEQGAEIEVVKALEDVRAEITGTLETIIGKYNSNTKPEDVPSRKIERNNGRIEAIDIINRKIAEMKGDKT